MSPSRCRPSWSFLLALLAAVAVVLVGGGAPVHAAVEKTLHVEWQYDTSLPGLAGYRIYQDGNLVHTVNDPQALATDFTTIFEQESASFTMTAFDTDGVESAHSDPYLLTLPPGSLNPAGGLQAVIDATPTSGQAPLVVRFDGGGSVADGTVTSWDWEFGDGTVASGQVVDHTYYTSGVYTASLTVTDDTGATATASQEIAVTSTTTSGNLAPLAVATAGVTSGEAPLTVDFDGSGSRDEDGSITGYTWNFGDGTGDQGAQVQHTYTSPGVYTARLTVTDDEGATGTANVAVQVNSPAGANQPPIPILTADLTSGSAPLAVSFDATNSHDPDGTIAAYSWNFGDGATGSGGFVQHVYQVEGEYTARLTVTDDSGATATASLRITVQPQGMGEETVQYSGGVTVNGVPLAGMVLEVLDTGNNLVARYPVTDGAWATGPLPAGVTYQFQARYGREVLPVTPGQVEDWPLQLRAIAGTISGLPANAVVVVTAVSNDAKLLAGVRLASGSGTVQYRIANLVGAADYLVSATTLDRPVLYYHGALAAASATPVDCSQADATGIDFDFRMPATGTISGTVTQDGAPATEARVYAYDTVTAALQMTLADSAGHYALALAPGSYVVFATIGDRTYYWSASGPNQNYSGATVIAVESGTTKGGVDLAVQQCPYEIHGRVVDGANGDAPVAGAQLTARGERYLASGFTGADGSYTITGLCADDYSVFLLPAKENYPVLAKAVTLAENTPTATADFTVNDGFTLSGAITAGSTGQGIAGAQVYLRQEVTGELFGYRYFASDEQGNYAIHAIPTGTYTLYAGHPAYQTVSLAGVAVDQDLVRDLTLAAGGGIHGTVQDDQGAPLANLLVVAQAPGGEPRFARTDSQGRYAIRGLPEDGACWLMVQRYGLYGYQVAPEAVVATAASTQYDFTVVPVDETFDLTGTVSLDSGAPVAGARVVVSRRTASELVIKSTVTGNDGSYQVKGLPAGPGYLVTVIPGNGLRVATAGGVDGSAGGTVTQDVTIASGDVIAGTVRLVGVDTPVYAVLYDDQHHYVDYVRLRATGTDGEYTFRFDHLPAGSYRLVLGASGHQPMWYDGADSFYGATPVSPGDPPLAMEFGP